MEEVIPQQGTIKRSSSSIIPALRSSTADSKKGVDWPITFRHLGKAGFDLTLYAGNPAARQKFLENIDRSQQKLRGRADFFNTTIVSSNFFSAMNKVNCVAPYGMFSTPNSSSRNHFKCCTN